MGTIAEAFVAYAQPLFDQTDGSEGQLKKAFALSHFCFDVSLMPDDSRDQVLSEMKLTLKMNDEEFDDFRRFIVFPMIRRHKEMFPQMHRQSPTDFSPSGTSFQETPANGGAYRSAPADRSLRTVPL